MDTQSLSFSKKRSIVLEENQGEMSYEGTPVKAPPNTRRRMMPPTLQQISFSSTDECPVASGSGSTAVIAAMENYLDKTADMKVEIEELKLLMDPEDSEVCLRYIPTRARRRGSRIFEIISTKENSDHLVASKNRWLEYQERRVAQQERSQSEWQDVNYEGKMAKAPPCPKIRMRTPLPQESSPSTTEEVSPWSARERNGYGKDGAACEQQ